MNQKIMPVFGLFGNGAGGLATKMYDSFPGHIRLSLCAKSRNAVLIVMTFDTGCFHSEMSKFSVSSDWSK
jgi:hypothetical protein